MSADIQSVLVFCFLLVACQKPYFDFTDTHWVCFDVMNLWGLWPVSFLCTFDYELSCLFVRSTLCFRRSLLSVHTWGRHTLSVLQPTCGLQSDQRLIFSQGSISLHDSISIKDSTRLGADCSLPVAQRTGLRHNRRLPIGYAPFRVL